VRERNRVRVLLICCCCALAATAASGPTAGAAEPTGDADTLELTKGKKGKGGKGELTATIRRTKYGIPHIKADDIESLAAGYAYAYAEDNICTLANEYVTVAGKRSQYFGPDEEWYFSGNGTSFRNLDADFYFKWVSEQGTVRELMNLPPPLGPK
jgi:acyl-homoserine-lactone acylase